MENEDEITVYQTKGHKTTDVKDATTIAIKMHKPEAILPNTARYKKLFIIYNASIHRMQ